MVDIYWYGQACFKIKSKNTSVILDPFSGTFTGLKEPKLDADIVCVTHGHEDHNNSSVVKGTGENAPFLIAGPGEYEIGGVNIVGVSSFHDDSEGKERGKNTIYQITIEDVNVVHLGDLGQRELKQAQVEALSCDILLIPTGGVYTINGKEAPAIIAQLEPKIVIPMHYKVGTLKFDLEPVEEFLKAMGKENVERLPKLSISRDKLPDESQIAVLEQSI